MNKLKDLYRAFRSRNYLIVTVDEDGGIQYGTNICDHHLADIGFFIGQTHNEMDRLNEEVKEALK